MLALGLGLVLAWFLAGTLARPLQRLAALRGAWRRDLDARADARGLDGAREVAHRLQRHDRAGWAGPCGPAASSSRTRSAISSGRAWTGLRLRLEVRGLADRPSEPAAELEAAEREVERLARLLGAPDARPRRATDGASPSRCRLRRARGRAGGPSARRRATTASSPTAELTRGHPTRTPGDRSRQPDRERAQVLPGAGTVTVELRPRGLGRLHRSVGRGSPSRPGEEEHVFERPRPAEQRKQYPGDGSRLAIVAMLARRWGGTARITTGSRAARAPKRDCRPRGVPCKPRTGLGRGFTRPRLAWIHALRDCSPARPRLRDQAWLRRRT